MNASCLNVGVLDQ